MKPNPRTKKSRKQPERTVVTMVVDASSSMARLHRATCAGFNEYVETLKKERGEFYFSAITFSSLGIKKLQVGVPIRDAVRLGADNYQTVGSTPLLDAIGQAIKATSDAKVAHYALKAIVVIQTDGEENTSVCYTLTDIKALIEDRQSQGWQFVFIGAGINAFADAQKMGIVTMNTMSYSPDAVGTRATFHATASNSAGYAGGTISSMAYTDAQSNAAGESVAITRAKKAAHVKPIPTV